MTGPGLRKDTPCEVNWLDPEPDRESSNYGQYIEELQKIENEVWFYKGFHQPPTEELFLHLTQLLSRDKPPTREDYEEYTVLLEEYYRVRGR
jgi:hypothetical protein